MDTSCRSIVIAATSSGDPPTTKPAFSARGWLTPPTSVLPTAWKSFADNSGNSQFCGRSPRPTGSREGFPSTARHSGSP
ncbi:hypothetical protein PF006_g9356 [Phytophthora fragariae]|nr:hypothetical protein PF009_g11179 [Phytophthora fragariae]KAE9145825.1 hypothetical protein PF006_g9356 [Phytophthora fragariae]